MARPGTAIALGVAANWPQFVLLIVVNAFVGAMVGLERAILPLIAEREFGLVSSTFILSFIVSFGVVKALANLTAGGLADRLGRKPILVAGWVVGLPVPFLIILAPSWEWIVFANALLGVNQGLCWSMTVIMKIDLVGPARRGLAMGLNEFAGYLAAALAAVASGVIAAQYGLRPEPFYLGVVLASLGLALSVFAVRETRAHARYESTIQPPTSQTTIERPEAAPSFRQVLLLGSWRERSLAAVSQAGLVNNLNDGMAWGLLPLFFAIAGLGPPEIGLLAACYLGVWGLSQTATGALSDRVGRKPLIVAGLWTQAFSIALVPLGHGFEAWLGCMALFGFGTALVYPALLAAVSDVARPQWRSSAVGVYRLWRDAGYAVGALLAGLLADTLGFDWAIGGIAALTFASGVVVQWRMYETVRAGPASGR